MTVEQSTPIQIILIEDFHAETEVLLRELREAELRFEHRVARSEEEFATLLDEFDADVILSPYSLKGTNALKLLGLARSKNVQGPFILLAFDLSEDIAIDLLAEGVEDYILRSTIKRLPVAIRKALQRYKTQLELKISEARLRSSESLLREAQSIAKIGSWTLNPSTEELKWSDEMYVIHGVENKNINVDEIRNLILPEDHELFDSSMVKLVGGEDTTMVYRIRLANTNDIKYLLANGRVKHHEDKSIRSISGTVQDVSDRIVTQLELERSQASLMEAQKIAKVGSWEWDVGSEHVWWSEVMFEIYETDKQEITISNIKGFIHPDDRQRVEELTSHDLGDKIEPVVEYRILLGSGKVKHVVSSAKQVRNADGKVTRLIGTLQDVTEKVESEREAKANQIQRELTLQASKIGVWSWVMKENELVWDDRCFEIYEIPRQGLTVDEFMRRMLPEDRQNVQSGITAALSNGNYQSEYRINTDSGIKHLHGRGKVTFDEDGNPIRMDGIIIDMTERQKIEDELRESEQLFRDMAESITEVFWLTDWEQNEVLYVSPQYEDLYGLSVESLYKDSSSWSKYIHPDDLERATTQFREKAITGEYEEEYRLIMQDGTMKWVRDRAFPVFDSKGNVCRIAGITEDVTARRLDKERIETLSLVASETINGVLIHEPDGKVIWLNKGFQSITGYSAEEMIGKEPWSVLSGEDTNQKLVEMTYEKIKAGKSFTCDNQLLHKDGYHVWVNVSFTPIMDDFGNVTKVVSIGMDITNQKETERSQREMLEKLEKANEELKRRASY